MSWGVSPKGQQPLHRKAANEFKLGIIGTHPNVSLEEKTGSTELLVKPAQPLQPAGGFDAFKKLVSAHTPAEGVEIGEPQARPTKDGEVWRVVFSAAPKTRRRATGTPDAGSLRKADEAERMLTERLRKAEENRKDPFGEKTGIPGHLDLPPAEKQTHEQIRKETLEHAKDLAKKISREFKVEVAHEIAEKQNVHTISIPISGALKTEEGLGRLREMVREKRHILAKKYVGVFPPRRENGRHVVEFRVIGHHGI
ncbi:MAG: hypothetical protein WC792_06285 [Candidatus Micrarchaeia archaeon]